MWVEVLYLSVALLSSSLSPTSARYSRDARRSADGNWTLTQQCTVSCGGGLLLETRANGSTTNTRSSTVKCNAQLCPFSDYPLILEQMEIATSSVVQNFSQSLFRLAGVTGLQQQGGFSALAGFFNSFGVCTATGDPHYTTFDGKPYSYYTSCSYYAVYDRDKTNTYPRFSVIIETGPCGAGSLTCVQKARVILASSCDASSGLATSSGDMTFDFFPSGAVHKNGRDITGTLPDAAVDSLVTVSRSGGHTTLTSYCHGIHTSLFGTSFTALASSDLRGQVLGLCGTFDGNQNTDFTLMDGTTITNDLDRFAQAYQLPSQGSGCVSPPLPPSCNSFDDLQPIQLCNAMNSGNFAVCNDASVCSSPKNPVSPKTYVDNCVVDVCQCAVSEREKCACLAYIPYAVECRRQCSLQIDLKEFPGCGVPSVNLTPVHRTVWQGDSATYQCSLTSGYPTAPLEFSINGKDIDTMSNVSVNCSSPNLCNLNIHRAIEGKDNGTIVCRVNNVVGEDSKAASLNIRVGSFSVHLLDNVLVGSRTYVQVTKTPADNPVQHVQLKLVALRMTIVTELEPSIPSNGEYEWDVKGLPKNAYFDTWYALKVYDPQSEFEGFSNLFRFKRDVIDIKVPVDKHGHLLDPPLAYLGRTTRFGFNYSHSNIFIGNISVTLVDENNNVAEMVGTVSPHRRLPNVVNWVPGTSNDVPSGTYRLHAEDSGTTEAEGTSSTLSIKHGSLCIIGASHLTYGSEYNIFLKEQPDNLQGRLQFKYHVVLADDCKAEVADVTGYVWKSPPSNQATWSLGSILPNVNIGLPYRLRATRAGPSYVQGCSDNIITFAIAKIDVSFEKPRDVAYINHAYLVKFRVPRYLTLVADVSVSVHCYGVNRTWTIASRINKNLRRVWWKVGQEELEDPITSGLICYVSVRDYSNSGASGRTENVTVARACVSTNPEVTTTLPMQVGVLFRTDQNLSDMSVALVNATDTSQVMLSFLDSEITVGDNELTIQRARVPALSCLIPVQPLVVAVNYVTDAIAAFSDPVTFHGWPLSVKAVDKNGHEVDKPLYPDQDVYITASVPEDLLQLGELVTLSPYLRNTSGCFPIGIVSQRDGGVTGNCTHDVLDCYRNVTFHWKVGTLPENSSTIIYPGNYTFTVKDEVRNQGTFLVEGQSKEIEIEGPALVRVSVANISKPNLPDRHSGENRNTSSNDSNGSSKGTVAGIVVGVVMALMLLALVVVIVIKRMKRDPYESRTENGISLASQHNYRTLPKQDEQQ
ncbi:uncharacterized protein LOC134193620 isoform X2 [Corticium candelabrum]|uniref:uncharacterized protein LOC134193620 isoform X2 n=1 Tax=Corticium candelabrum TaxID=121492 RepID=UPI002E269CD4|nr:uncharacterized protein LOC134193620 isoform X2 [Corticium candelabrum]